MNFVRKYKHYFSLHAIIFLWGFTGILGKLISISSYSIVWWRMLIAFLGLVVFMAVSKRSLKTTTKQAGLYLFTGLITAAHWIFFFEALKVSNVSITLTTLASTSFFVALVEPIFLKRRLIPYEVALGLITMAGLAIIFQAESDLSLGVIYALCAAVLAAVFSSMNAIFVRSAKPTLITTYEMIGGVLGITVYMLLNGTLLPFEQPTLADWWYLIILGTVCTSLAFVVSIQVMKELSPFTVSMSINMEPIYAIIFALLIFKEDEYMSPLFYVGAVIVLSMIFLNGYLKRLSKRKISRAKTSDQPT